jgi:hypothetical protein
MTAFPEDIYSEPRDVDVETLRNLGPLRALAGVWQGREGQDIKPKAEGARQQTFVERMELQPIDPQTNGPQLLYGLRYHTHIVKPGQVGTYHDQIGYWLWERSTSTVIHTLTIPRGQVVMAAGQAAADASEFELGARQGDPNYGICSTPFLDYAFRTVAFSIRVRVHSPDSWSYAEDTVLMIRCQSDAFHHRDSNTLVKIGEPTPNPLARAPRA